MGEADRSSRGRFPTTRWSLVARAGQRESATEQRISLGQLLTLYLPVLRTHLVETKRIAPDRADDLLQGFVSAKFIEQNLPALADQSRGRFRTFVLTALDRFIIDERRHESADKRAADHAKPTDPEILATQVADCIAPARAFDVAWARQVLMRAVQRMQAECQSSARPDIWGVFESRILGPTLDGTTPPDYPALVGRFGFKSPTQASNVLITAKRMFERALRAVIGEYAASPAEVDEEIRDLCQILADGRAGAD